MVISENKSSKIERKLKVKLLIIAFLVFIGFVACVPPPDYRTPIGPIYVPPPKPYFIDPGPVPPPRYHYPRSYYRPGPPKMVPHRHR